MQTAYCPYFRDREPNAPLTGSSNPASEPYPARQILARALPPWLRRHALRALLAVLALGSGYVVWRGEGYTRRPSRVAQSRMQAYIPTVPSVEPIPTAADPSAAVTFTVTSPAAPVPPPRAYSSPTRIRIPRINVDAPVVAVTANVREENGESVTVWQVADFAAGFHLVSAYPGHPGNTVISAHNNIRGRVFRHLIDLVPGDNVYLYVGDREFRYVVTQCILVKETGAPEEIRRDNAEWIQPTTDERLTLVSCWPFVKPDHRVVVVARPIAQ